MRTLYIECKMGAAGDMLMASLYELLEDKQGFLDTMNGLGLPGVRLEAQKSSSCGIAGTHMKVTVHGEEEHEPAEGHDHEHNEDADHEHDSTGEHSHEHGHDHDHEHHHATPRHIADLINGLKLPEKVKGQARAVYRAIAEAEARAHGCPVGDVHFHEVGALDAVADVTGVCYALYLLQPERIVVSPIHVGSGTVRCAHGVMPVPAPATAVLLTGVPIYGGAIQGELCTPTGAALLAHFADSFGEMPLMAVKDTGIGIGTKTFEQANCVRAFLGEEKEETEDMILELVCNIDDMTPEALAFACTRLMELGALDVYTVAGTMKKGRPGHVLTVLCRPEKEEELARHILTQTTTNGLRVRRCGKYFLAPGMGKVRTRWGDVRVKTAKGYGITHMKPEYEDVAEVARRENLPYQRVEREVRKRLK
ncbi:MAG TPA: nickel pincer cofactor biosynthesis protein LarC [Candidatus Mediterraneibacter faecigallinarum]|uniref:Pyridinium-3,5-bisthiocarboxylic acid mononucleotide nickel insertion protein n=1 Tax=Candidatus Mediterraneibacter faecigallinarum TaxID=2838669 RepID=A0A9D2SZJ7_9FIRM|nr:nickel pincer cofactor biosynthesis protein LarC [Candidatus Mediterraneibacter faecigallinarum]